MATIRRAIPVGAYRSDVDGLRAIAVCAVLFFHAFPKLFSGGFIGVDIFFVISGFLITGNIDRDIQSGAFSIRGFYLRRVRRIFPALLLVLACCLIAGWALLTRSEFMQLGKHTAAAAGFAANFFYWAESGYFDSAAITKPLLHLWSLGVEEQFYLLWPLLILISRRRGKSRELALAVLSLSFVACVLTTAPLSYGAFYSPATRMWELALGGILALTFGKSREGSDEGVAANWMSGHSWLAELVSFVGIALIAVAVWAFDANTPYPGWKALLPTLGAGLVIGAGRSAFFNRWLLSHPVMVFVGLISYPLYLWHWPLLSFANILGLGTVSTPLTIGLLVASVVLASGTYLLLERPLRRTILNWRVGGGMVTTMACLGIAGGLVYASGGAKPSSHSLAGIGNTHPLQVPDSNQKPVPPRAPAPPPPQQLESVSMHTPIGGQPEELAPAATKVIPSNGDPAVTPAAPSRLMLYRKRVSDALLAHPGKIDPYLSEVGQTRLDAVRSGICEFADVKAESLDSAGGAARFKDGLVCGGPVDGATNILVMGDSTASDAYAWLHAAYPEYNIIQKTGPGCNLQRNDSDNPKPCTETFNSARDMALRSTEKLAAVVLASLWNLGTPQDVDRTPAGPLIDQLLAKGRKVVLVGPPVGFTVAPADLIDKCPSSSKDELTLEELDQCVKEHANVRRECNTILKQYAQQKGLPYVDLHELTCNDSQCPILDEEGQLMFIDVWHRTFPGDAFVARRVRQKQLFEQVLNPQ